VAPKGRQPDMKVPADRPFGNPGFEPTEDGLERTLGAAIGPFDVIRGLSADFAQEWTFYRGSGWMMRIHDGHKSLAYVVPLRNAFKLSMAIREAERDALLADAAVAPLHETLSAARKLPEGYALAFDVDADSDFAPLRALFEKLVAARKA